MFIPSVEQEAAINYVLANRRKQGRKALAIRARAGTGKTATIVEIIKRSDARGVYCAFNRDIVTEVAPKLAGTQVQAKTFHQLALGSLLKHLSTKYFIKPSDDWSANDSKYKAIIESLITPELEIAFESTAAMWQAVEMDYTREDVRKAFIRQADNLVHFLRVKLVEWDDIEELEYLVFDYGLDEIPLYEDLIPAMVAMMKEVMTIGERQLIEDVAMDYDDMVYWAVRWDVKCWYNDWVFVDEAQDLSPMQRAMVNKVLNQRNGFIVIVGDDRQAIYRFAGADSDSFDKTVAFYNADVLPLTVTRRCAQIIVHHATRIVADFQAIPEQKRGKIVWMDEEKFIDHAKPGDMVICRVKAPLIKRAIELISKEIPATILGGNIGAALIDLMERISKRDDFTWANAAEAVDEYRAERVRFFLEKEDEVMADATNDDCDALDVLLENSKAISLDTFAVYVNSLFSNKSSQHIVTLCTGHKSKGLEAPRVFLLAPEKMPLKFQNMHPESALQELNLEYVAGTRPKEVLVYLTNEKFLEPYDKGWETKPSYVQDDFEEHQWSEDGLFMLDDKDSEDNAIQPGEALGEYKEEYEMEEPERLSAFALAEHGDNGHALLESLDETEEVQIVPMVSIDLETLEVIDNRLEKAHANLKRAIRFLRSASDASEERDRKDYLISAERYTKDFDVETSRVNLPYSEALPLLGEENHRVFKWNNLHSRVYNLMDGRGNLIEVHNHAIALLQSFSKSEALPSLSIEEAADVLYAPVQPVDFDNEDAPIILPPRKPSVSELVSFDNDLVHLTSDFSTDRGVFNRAVAVAQLMRQAGLWDGVKHIRFANAYEIHKQVMGIDRLPLEKLVLTEVYGELLVELPKDNPAENSPEGEKVAEAAPVVEEVAPPDDAADKTLWAKWLLSQKERVVILDTETTDFQTNLPNFEMVQLGVINLDGEEVLNRFIVPYVSRITDGAAAVHGITHAVLSEKGATSLITQYEDIKAALQGKYIVAYNAPFDRAALENSLKLCGLPPIEIIGWNCAMRVYTKHNPNKTDKRGKRGTNWKLTEAVAQQGLAVDDNAHDALADVKMTLALIKSMAADEPNRWQETKSLPAPKTEREYQIGDTVKVKASGVVAEIKKLMPSGELSIESVEDGSRLTVMKGMVEPAPKPEEVAPAPIESEEETNAKVDVRSMDLNGMNVRLDDGTKAEVLAVDGKQLTVQPENADAPIEVSRDDLFSVITGEAATIETLPIVSEPEPVPVLTVPATPKKANPTEELEHLIIRSFGSRAAALEFLEIIGAVIEEKFPEEA